MSKSKGPVAETAMLIRKPVEDVFEAFVDPAITSKFWFTDGSARLDAGKPVKWNWKMYDVSADVRVKAIVANKCIVMDWGDENGMTEVVWTFEKRPGGTFVSVANSGFQGDPGQAVNEAIGSTGGFTWVLAGAKAWLEHGLQLGFIADRHPDRIAA